MILSYRNIKTLLTSFITLFIALSAIAQSMGNQPLVVKQIVYRGEFAVNSDDMNRAANLREGMTLHPDQLSPAIDAIQQFLQDEGYLYAIIDSAKIELSGNQDRDLIIWGRSGRQAQIGDFKIKFDSLQNNFLKRVLYFRAGEPYSQKIVENQIDVMLEFLAEEGYLFAEVRVDSLRFYEKDGLLQAAFILRVYEGSQARLQGVILVGNFYTHDNVILREIGLQNGDVCTTKKIERIPRQLMRLGIFKEVSQPEIFREKGNWIQLKIIVKEGNATTFDGVVGYIPEQNNDGYFSGRIDLAFRNLFGANRKLNVFWEKPDRLTEEFHFSYTEPWALSYPLSILVGVDRVVRDTSFVEWALRMEGNMRLFGDFSALGGVYRKSSFPDSAASRDMRLLRNAVLNIFIGMEMDNRDNPVNPTEGAFFRLNYSYGFKTNYGPSYLLTEDNAPAKERVQSYELRFDWYNYLWLNQVLAVKLSGWQIDGDRIQLTDYKWFGGYHSVRGYREQQFRSDRLAWSNLEYRFLTGVNSRIFAFCDFGYYKNYDLFEPEDEWLMGYGAGLRFETGMGILGVDFGLARGDIFSEGKIHFGIINKF